MTTQYVKQWEHQRWPIRCLWGPLPITPSVLTLWQGSKSSYWDLIGHLL